MTLRISSAKWRPIFSDSVYQYPCSIENTLSIEVSNNPFVKNACNTTLNLTYWGRVTHICVGNLIIIDSGVPPWSVPSHYLNQSWNIANWTHGNQLQWDFNRHLNNHLGENAFENVVCEMTAILSRPQCVLKLWSHTIRDPRELGHQWAFRCTITL